MRSSHGRNAAKSDSSRAFTHASYDVGGDLGELARELRRDATGAVPVALRRRGSAQASSESCGSDAAYGSSSS